MSADVALAPDAVTSLPGAAAAAVAWRLAGQLHVTVIAKATFSFVIDAPMRRSKPQEILRAEVHHANNPGRSIRLSGSYGCRVRTDLPEIVSLAARGLIDVSKAISRRYPLDQCGEAYQALGRGEILGRAVLTIP